VDLSDAQGELTLEWMKPVEGTIVRGGSVAGGKRVNFAAPFPGAAVLYARRN